MLDHAFCTIHRIGYNALLDPSCPQCALQRMAPPEQLEYDTIKQKPVGRDGTLLNARTLQPEK